MELKANKLAASFAGFNQMPMLRQIGLMVGLAASVAIGVAVVLWSQTPSYRMLYGNVSDQEKLEISQALQQAQIPFELNQDTGAILVPADRVHDARMKLASAGLPKGTGSGYDLLDKDQGFGTSQFIETARYQRALEGELAKTIASINSVKSARVHLAIPKQSGFVREQRKPSGSVMVQLYPGRSMAPEQAASIVHLVASSVPGLEPDNVTVVDQGGHLLSSNDTSTDMKYSASQFDYRKKLEDYYIKRIEAILAPIVGQDRVRAQVVADLDFTVTEQTQESYNPDLPSVRSEQTIEEANTGNSAPPAGIPGATSNQPPAGGTVGQAAIVSSQKEGGPSSSSRRIVRNYELDRTISHSRLQSGSIRRLSAAIVLDHKRTKDSAGKETVVPLTDAEMARITALVKEAIGFDSQRGDSVNVINAPFQEMKVSSEDSSMPFYEQPWLWDLLKQLAGIAVVLILIFGVLRPVLKSLAEKGQSTGMGSLEQGALSQDLVQLSGGQMAQRLAAPVNYEQQLANVRTTVSQDPRRVAQVMKEWVESDG